MVLIVPIVAAKMMASSITGTNNVDGLGVSSYGTSEGGIEFGAAKERDEGSDTWSDGLW